MIYELNFNKTVILTNQQNSGNNILVRVPVNYYKGFLSVIFTGI